MVEWGHWLQGWQGVGGVSTQFWDVEKDGPRPVAVSMRVCQCGVLLRPDEVEKHWEDVRNGKV